MCPHDARYTINTFEKLIYFYFTEQRHMDANTAALNPMRELELEG